MASLLFWSHVAATVGATALATWLAARIRRRFDRPTAGWMWRLLAVLGLWGGVLTLQILSPTLAFKVLFHKVGTALGWASLLLWFLFVLEFTARGHWLTRRVKLGLAGVYAVLVGLIVTDPMHGLLWRDFFLATQGFPHLATDEGMLNLTIFGILFGLAVVGFALVVKNLLTSRQVSRRQLATVLLGFVLAAPSAVIESAGIAPAPYFEYGPMASMVFFMAVGYGIFRHDLFVVAPFARDAVLEALKEGVVVVDVDGHVADFNESAASILPELEGSFGKAFLSIVPQSIRPDGGTAELPAALDDEIERTVGGDRTVFSVDASPLEQGGRTRGYAVLFRDQTEIEEYAGMLERQTERLDQFASVVSHDLRNPLSVARGQLELARETGDDEAFEKATDALERMDDIIEDALALSRGTEESVPDEPASLREAASSAWAQTDTGEATFEDELPAEDAGVLAEPERLETLLENLFRNAIEHGPADVTVRVRGTDHGFAVEDTGPGIPPEDRHRVFERRFSTGERNTGLGLAIVADIVESYGWNVNVTESAEGGACFEFATGGR